MTQQHKIGKTATTVATDSNGVTRVTYHQTVVVTFDDKTITLDHGGWMSNTTKTRMNQTANQFDLRFGVYQDDYKWFINIYGDWNAGKGWAVLETIPFLERSITFPRPLS